MLAKLTYLHCNSLMENDLKEEYSGVYTRPRRPELREVSTPHPEHNGTIPNGDDYLDQGSQEGIRTNSSETLVILGKVAGQNFIKICDIPYMVSPEGYIGISLSDISDFQEIQALEGTIWVRMGSVDINEIEMQDLENKIILAGGNVVFDLERNSLTVNNRPAHITKRECEILHYFNLNRGLVLTRQQIIDGVYGNWFSSDKIIDVHVSTIRKRLGDYKDLITTIRGKGYVFDDIISEINS